MSADKNVFSVCACADPWCREHGCRLATQQRYGPQTHYAPVLTALPLPVADAVAEERAAVVAYLREQANAEHPIERGVPSLSPAGRGLLLLNADRIERGEHRREEDR